MSVGARIKSIRGVLTRDEFSERIGADKSTVQRWENDQGIPKGDLLLRIHKEFGVDLTWLLTGKGVGPGPGVSSEIMDDRGLWGKTRDHEIEGKRFTVSTFAPRIDRDRVEPFAQAVAALRDIFDSRDPILVPAIQANIRAFQLAAERERYIQAQTERIEALEKECADLKKRISTLEKERRSNPSAA